MESESRAAGREFDPSDPFKSFWSTTRDVWLDPRGFFSRLPTFSSLNRALAFGLICLLVASVFVVVFAAVSGGWPVSENPALRSLRDAGPLRSVGAAVLYAMFWPLLALLQLCIYAGVAHLFAALFMKETLGFGATLRVVCYASATALLSWVPVAGWLAELYRLYVILVGVRRVHGHDPRAGSSL